MSKKEFFPPRPSTNPTMYADELVGVVTHKVVEFDHFKTDKFFSFTLS